MGLANHSGQMKKEEKTHKSQGGVHRGKHLPQLIHTSSTKSKQLRTKPKQLLFGVRFPFFFQSLVWVEGVLQFIYFV